MVTKNQQRAMDLYQAMMEEMKLRIDAIEFAASGLLQFHPVINQEFAYLQLRMMCELIALGCLLAHGDIAATHTLRKTWSADEIIKRLGELHPDFYPHPVEQIVHPDHMELRQIDTGFLTKEELMALNGQCGSLLHRGSITKLRAGPLSPRQISEITSWVSKIRCLLKCHRIGLLGGTTHFVCLMSAQNYGGRAQVAFAEAPLPPAQLSPLLAPHQAK